MTKTIAITGGIGSGKSTFCSKLKEKGFKIHSSDEQVAKIYKNPQKKFVTYLRTIGLSKSISKKNIDKKRKNCLRICLTNCLKFVTSILENDCHLNGFCESEECWKCTIYEKRA